MSDTGLLLLRLRRTVAVLSLLLLELVEELHELLRRDAELAEELLDDLGRDLSLLRREVALGLVDAHELQAPEEQLLSVHPRVLAEAEELLRVLAHLRDVLGRGGAALDLDRHPAHQLARADLDVLPGRDLGLVG